MKIKISFIFMFVVFRVTELFARAGGGSGGGSGGGGGGGGGFRGGFYRRGHGGGTFVWKKEDTITLIIAIVAIGILVFVSWKAYKWLISYRSRIANKKMLIIAQDPLWEKEALLKFVEETYLGIQKAWMEQDLDSVRHLLSEKLYSNYQFRLNKQREVQIYNFIDKIRIKNIKIVGLEDFLDDSKDNFTVYIYGDMVDKVIRRGSESKVDSRPKSFEDLYYFRRENNSWIVYNIENEISFGEMFFGNQVFVEKE